MKNRRNQRQIEPIADAWATKYVAVGRILNVLEALKDGPLTTVELCGAIRISERSTHRLMGAMLHKGWPVIYQKTETSGRLKWSFDLDKLVQKLKPNTNSRSKTGGG